MVLNGLENRDPADTRIVGSIPSPSAWVRDVTVSIRGCVPR